MMVGPVYVLTERSATRPAPVAITEAGDPLSAIVEFTFTKRPTASSMLKINWCPPPAPGRNVETLKLVLEPLVKIRPPSTVKVVLVPLMLTVPVA